MKINANVPAQPPKVVDIVTAVEAAKDKIESVFTTQKEDAIVSTSATPVVAAPHVSWLKHVGQVIGRILGIVAKDVKPVADTAAQVATALFPQWAVLIAAGDSLVTKIAAQATAVESVAAAAGTAAGTGVQKLEQVLGDVGPAIDQWVANAFPGSKALSAATKAGLINAVVAILNEVEGTPAATSPQ